MNVKKNVKEGQCRAMRCTANENGFGFCARHEEQAEDEGLITIPLPSTTDKKDKVELAGMQAGLTYAQAEIDSTDGAVITRAMVDNFKAELGAVLADVPELVSDLDGVVIDSDETMEAVNEHLGSIKSKVKDIESVRKTVTGPLNKITEMINSSCREPKKSLAQAEKTLKAKIKDVLDVARQAQDEALKAVEAAAGEAPTEVLAVAHGGDMIIQPSNIFTIDKWEVTIQNIDQIPREFLLPDLQKLKAYAQITNGIAVPGVLFTKTVDVRHRGHSK